MKTTTDTKIVNNIMNEYLNVSRHVHYSKKENKLGLLGELTVKHLFNSKSNSIVESSDNLFDEKSDLTIINNNIKESIEVKTQPRWKMRNAFTVYKTTTNNNLNKCLEVDNLVFVEPGLNNEVRIFVCTDRTYRTDNTGYIERYLFDVNKMKLIYTVIDEKLCNAMINLSNTEYRWLS